MIRVLILIALNLSLPFLLWWLWRALLRFYLRKKGRELHPERWAYPVIKLLLAGILLLLATLLVDRVFLLDADPSWTQGNKSLSIDF